MEHRYRNEWIAVIARSVAQKISERAELRRSLPRTAVEYQELLRGALGYCACANRHVLDLRPPNTDAVADRDALTAAIRLCQAGLTDYLVRVEARDWEGVRRGSQHLEQACKLLLPLTG